MPTVGSGEQLRRVAAVAYAFGQNMTRREPLRRVPPLFGHTKIEYRHAHWSLAAEMRAAAAQTRLAQGDKDDNRIPLGGTPGWWVCHVHAGWVHGHYSAVLSGINLFNKDYRYHGSGINGLRWRCRFEFWDGGGG